MADYYAKWLLGDFSQPVDMLEMNREIEMSGNKTKR
jgi:dipeptidyl-peptidase-4